jgi:predicted  nucleic acid-binding Zn-ribbon protein
VVTAAPSAQLRLLDLQAIDTSLAQLAHKRAHLPELATIASSGERMEELHGQTVELDTDLSDLLSEQRRLENDIDVVRSREERDQQRLAAGGLPGKELEGLQHELESLARRQASLEDSALEVMEQREQLETRLAQLATERSQAGAELAAAAAARDTAWGAIDAETTELTAKRAAASADVEAELLALYEKVRAAQGGIGAAMLRHRRCEGCRLELAGSELGAVRQAAPDDVVRCENCRRILVRTPESGL